ncbi:transcription initiation factor TFIIE [Striga asiatica]|uniref:Transcription initiation factor TFIIE n=1 Tax=Striga asiatica TaxID=4170 RepID=A0A5A7Q3Z9_STRAF|nr:transcription initiation factor TFIIE [Striga asiatica]
MSSIYDGLIVVCCFSFYVLGLDLDWGRASARRLGVRRNLPIVSTQAHPIHNVMKPTLVPNQHLPPINQRHKLGKVMTIHTNPKVLHDPYSLPFTNTHHPKSQSQFLTMPQQHPLLLLLIDIIQNRTQIGTVSDPLYPLRQFSHLFENLLSPRMRPVASKERMNRAPQFNPTLSGLFHNGIPFHQLPRFSNFVPLSIRSV